MACQPRSGTPLTHAFCPATACFSDQSEQYITPTAEWNSSDPALAIVDRGIVEYRSLGEVVISATYRWQGGAPVTGVHRLTITDKGCTVSDPSWSPLCDGATGGSGSIRPGNCLAIRTPSN